MYVFGVILSAPVEQALEQVKAALHAEDPEITRVAAEARVMLERVRDHLSS
jgi:hypothetical protein